MTVTIDLRFDLRPDGLHRACILCGADFRITPAVDVLRETAAGRIAEVVFTEVHPRNLLQLTCGHCPKPGGSEGIATGGGDPRWQLRRDGLESWRDANG